jgi:hypothetical protein
MGPNARNLLPVCCFLLACVLSACGGDGGGKSNTAGISCQSLAGQVDAPQFSNSCTGNCIGTQAVYAADGEFGTAATLGFTGSASGSVAVRATAKGGGVFAAGSMVGVIFEASSATQSGVNYQINTYRQGIQQESFDLGSDGIGSPARPITHSGDSTTLPYDTVEFKFTRAAGTTDANAMVYELCSN